MEIQTDGGNDACAGTGLTLRHRHPSKLNGGANHDLGHRAHSDSAPLRRARSRIAQRIQDLFRCGAGLFRGVPGLVRCCAGAVRTRGSLVRCWSGHDRVTLGPSRAGWPSSPAVVVKSHAAVGNCAAEVVQIGRGPGITTGVCSRTGASSPGSIGTVTSSTAEQAAPPGGQPQAMAEQGQSAAGQGWVGAGKGKHAAEEARIGTKQVMAPVDLAWSRAAWGAMVTARVSAPAVMGRDEAKEGWNERALGSPFSIHHRARQRVALVNEGRDRSNARPGLPEQGIDRARNRIDSRNRWVHRTRRWMDQRIQRIDPDHDRAWPAWKRTPRSR